MYFRKYQLRKPSLDECLKNRVSEDPSTDNMANGSKHFWNLNDSTFINPCGGNYVGTSFF